MAEVLEKPTAASLATARRRQETFRERLIGIAREKFRIDRDTAEYLLQETAVILVGTDAKIRKPDGFAYRVFYSRCCHFVERQASRKKLRAVSDKELALAFRHGLARLSPTCQKLLRGHYLEGRTLDAAEQGLVSRSFARLKRIDAAVKEVAVAITPRRASKVELPPIGDRTPDTLTCHFDELLAGMQTSRAREGIADAFDATPAQLGKAAVAAATKGG